MRWEKSQYYEDGGNMSASPKNGTPCRSSATNVIPRRVTSTTQVFHGVKITAKRSLGGT
jgi:hypothetical protein